MISRLNNDHDSLGRLCRQGERRLCEIWKFKRRLASSVVSWCAEADGLCPRPVVDVRAIVLGGSAQRKPTDRTSSLRTMDKRRENDEQDEGSQIYYTVIVPSDRRGGPFVLVMNNNVVIDVDETQVHLQQSTFKWLVAATLTLWAHVHWAGALAAGCLAAFACGSRPRPAFKAPERPLQLAPGRWRNLRRPRRGATTHTCNFGNWIFELAIVQDSAKRY